MYPSPDAKSPGTGLHEQPDGSWVAWIEDECFVGTRDECLRWLRGNDPSLHPVPRHFGDQR